MGRLSLRYAALSLSYMGGIFYLSSLPTIATGPDTPFWRFVSNAAHIPLFAGLALCLALTFRGWPALQRAALVLAIAVGYALFDEWHQGWIPGRSASVMDVGLDLAGIVLIVLALHRARGQP